MIWYTIFFWKNKIIIYWIKVIKRWFVWPERCGYLLLGHFIPINVGEEWMIFELLGVLLRWTEPSFWLIIFLIVFKFDKFCQGIYYIDAQKSLYDGNCFLWEITFHYNRLFQYILKHLIFILTIIWRCPCEHLIQ
jgi:hypothetical protein